MEGKGSWLRWPSKTALEGCQKGATYGRFIERRGSLVKKKVGGERKGENEDREEIGRERFEMAFGERA